MPNSVECTFDVNKNADCILAFVHADANFIYYSNKLGLSIVAGTEVELVVW